MPYGWYEITRDCREVHTWSESIRVYAEDEDDARRIADGANFDYIGDRVPNEWGMDYGTEDYGPIEHRNCRHWEVRELEWFDDEDDDEGEEESEENELVDDEPAVKIIPTHFLQNIKL